MGDLVNLEVDVLGKYFERFFQLGVKSDGTAGIKGDFRVSERSGLLVCACADSDALSSPSLSRHSGRDRSRRRPACRPLAGIRFWCGRCKTRISVAEFVVRIAEFLPDRFLEWEDSNTQGTIFMPDRDVIGARGFSSSNLFSVRHGHAGEKMPQLSG